MTPLRSSGKLFNGFADDLELGNDGILPHPLAHERVAAYRCVLFNVVDCVADVAEIDAVVLHSGRD